jgi:hypothetical protein
MPARFVARRPGTESSNTRVCRGSRPSVAAPSKYPLRVRFFGAHGAFSDYTAGSVIDGREVHLDGGVGVQGMLGSLVCGGLVGADELGVGARSVVLFGGECGRARSLRATDTGLTLADSDRNGGASCNART